MTINYQRRDWVYHIVASGHDVHPSTKIGSEWRYACWGRPRAIAPFMVQDGWHADGRANRVEYDPQYSPTPLSTRCGHDMSLMDWACSGCPWRGQGEANSKSVQEKANDQGNGPSRSEGPR